jgi:hypothetical protein
VVVVVEAMVVEVVGLTVVQVGPDDFDEAAATCPAGPTANEPAMMATVTQA